MRWISQVLDASQVENWCGCHGGRCRSKNTGVAVKIITLLAIRPPAWNTHQRQGRQASWRIEQLAITERSSQSLIELLPGYQVGGMKNQGMGGH
jgi:hypothetical protein